MQVTVQAAMQDAMQDERDEKLLKFCEIPKSREEMQEYVKINNRDYFRKEILNPLVKKGLLSLTIPDKPNSPKQKYVAGKIIDNKSLKDSEK